MLRVQKGIVEGDRGELERALEDIEERVWDWRNEEGRTVLELATVLGQSETVKLLVEAGATTNHLSASGYGALHLASVWGQVDCLKELVGAGANHRLSTTLGETPQQLALRYGNTACANYLACVEAKYVLNEAVQAAKNTLLDSELIAGKWNKEDKAKVNALCVEKTDWLAHSKEYSEEVVLGQTTNFHLRIQPHYDKLH